jgi:DivIVA domain-containing protein
VEQDATDRIRSATFGVARRGYDKREVDTYLARLADWLEAGGGDQARSEAVKHELERISRKTGEILTAAEEAAESFRADGEAEGREILDAARSQADSARVAADQYSTQTRAEADAYAEKTCSEADQYSRETRNAANEQATAAVAAARREATETVDTAEAEADEALDAAERKAIRMIEEATQKRREIETVISDLERRRDEVLASLEELSSDLAGAATQHKPEGQVSDDAQRRAAASGATRAAPQRPAGAAASQPAPSKPRAEPGK